MKAFHTDRARGGKRRQRAAIAVLATATLASVLGLAPAAHAVDYPVACDEEALIDRIEAANATVGVDDRLILAKDCEYEFEEAYFDEAAMVPALTDNALPVITDNLTIIGRGAEIVREVDEDDAEDEFFSPFRHLEIAAQVTVVINDVTFEGGLIASPGVPASSTSVAGSIFNLGDLTLNRVTVEDNEVFVFSGGAVFVTAGGILSNGPLTLNRSKVVDNEVTGIGITTVNFAGGVSAGDVTTVSKSTIKNNSVTAVAATGLNLVVGGGWAQSGGPLSTLTMSDSSVINNTVDSTTSGGLNIAVGGGIFTQNPTAIARSNVSGNRVESEGGLATTAAGGGIMNIDDLVVDDPLAPSADDDDQSRITNNTVSCEGTCLAVGGGYANTVPFLGALPGTATFNNTLFKGNLAKASDGIGLGGGLFLDGDGTPGTIETTLIEATVTKNTAKGDVFQAGGGMYATADAEVDLDDSRVFKNKPDDCAGAAVFGLCDD